jgi:hypothetical protein
MVKEPVEEISQRIVDYQRAVNSRLLAGVSDGHSNSGGADAC